jgi:hypothetical protein
MRDVTPRVAYILASRGSTQDGRVATGEPNPIGPSTRSRSPRSGVAQGQSKGVTRTLSSTHLWSTPKPSPGPGHHGRKIYVRSTRHPGWAWLTFPALTTEIAGRRRRSDRALSRARMCRGSARHGGERHVTAAVRKGKWKTRPWRKSRSGRIRRGQGGLGLCSGRRTAARVWGHEVAWGFDTGGAREQQRIVSRGKGGPNTVGSPTASTKLAGGGHRSSHRTRGGLRSRLCDPRARNRQ